MAVMRSKDAIRGADAECYVTIGGNRYNLMTLKILKPQSSIPMER